MLEPPLVPTWAQRMPFTVPTRARALAFYLPQFHPVPQNDAWWGKGFTEWTNVARAQPSFRGHYQPHLPADLGFCDLRVPEVRAAQAELAGASGIEGFCYWHYWFEGARLLERPIDEVLASGKPGFPFCLAWANESWSRRWLGEERDVLQAQTYSREDDRRHIAWLVRAFEDPRYVRVNGRPLFLVYRPGDLPDPRVTTGIWRAGCVAAGLPEPYLLGINAHARKLDAVQLGFDGTVDFEPRLSALPEAFDERPRLSRIRRNLALGIKSAMLKVYDDTEARALMAQVKKPELLHPTVFVGWDNTPRRGKKAVVIINGTPALFAGRLRQAIESIAHRPAEERLLFLNAWNEWAEGNHLEPDARWGTAYLDAVKGALCES